MPRKKKPLTKEEVDQQIVQLEKDIETLTNRIKEKKIHLGELRTQSKQLEQDRLLKLVLESGKDYSELVEILGK